MKNRKYSKKVNQTNETNISNLIENNEYYFGALLKVSDAIKYGFFDKIEYGEFRNLDEDYELNWLVKFVELDDEVYFKVCTSVGLIA